MGRRMFVAAVPPEDVREDLAEFLDVREGLHWTSADRMHLTLAFLPDVPERILEPLEERLRIAVADLVPFGCRLGGAGAFPHPDRPVVLWLGVERGRAELDGIARRVRGAANDAGAVPEGRRFVPHLTLARPPARAQRAEVGARAQHLSLARVAGGGGRADRLPAARSGPTPVARGGGHAAARRLTVQRCTARPNLLPRLQE